MIPYEELKDQVVLVTGGTQGIGEAVAGYFADQQCRVAINGRRLDDKVQNVLDRIGAFPAMGDIKDPVVAASVVQNTMEQFGRLDVLVANAAGMSMKPFLEQEEEEWWHQVKINLTGHIACIKEALPRMIRQGGGTIIIVSSFFGSLGWNNATGYGSSKSGLLTLGQHLSKVYAKDNIRVGIIIPGVIRTPQLNVDAQDLGITYEEVCDMYAKDIAMGRLGKPEEIAEMAVFMATEQGGKSLSGRHIQVSGGEYRSTPYYIW